MLYIEGYEDWQQNANIFKLLVLYDQTKDNVHVF